ncbi:restriction endonuclease subunit S [Bartonella apis]|uniref:restriction endonuclease subunit S n=1 Tax=Bartonella apis TaxID=1686310 RepID=UPI000963A21E|nr:restriction endonuclease subunit S [Bartonella apis]OLY47701.1 type I restriction enzyme, S subunit [Bartonella apis]
MVTGERQLLRFSGEWKRILLGQASLILRGGSPRPIQDYLTNSPQGINWIKIGDVKIDSKYIEHTKEKIIPEGENKSRRVQAGDFLLSNSMSFGRPYILKIDGCIHDGWLVIQNYHNVFTTEFLYYYLVSEQTMAQYIHKASGSSVLNLNKDLVSSVEIVYPDQREQSAIGEVLSDADSLIASLQRLIAKKKAIKQGAMQELLSGKRRLPGFSGELKTKKIKEIALILDHCRIPVKESGRQAMKGNIPYCGANGVLGFVNDYTIDDDIILVAEDGGYFDQFATRPIAYRMRGKCWVNNHAHILKAKVGIDQDYLFQALVNKDVTAYISSGTRSKLNKSELLKIEITLPEQVTAQRAIAQVLSDMDIEIEKLEKKLSEYQKIKQGMMQELLTGRIRLVDAEPKHEQPATASTKKHNQQFDDAVMIAGIVNAFHSETFPLGRKKVQKLLYLMRRKEKADVSAFHKKAAGPYADSVRYNGGETIAKKNNYIAVRTNGKGTLFSRGANIGKALGYIQSWGKEASIDWLTSNFQYTGVDDLELFATVDMAICDLRKLHKPISVQTIKEFIHSTEEWRDKLDKTNFSDLNIQRAINKCREFFGGQ